MEMMGRTSENSPPTCNPKPVPVTKLALVFPSCLLPRNPREKERNGAHQLHQ